MIKIVTGIVLILGLGGNAQTPVYSLVEDGYGHQQVPGVYYKDTHNDFNKFIGTWKYTNGLETFVITLQKKEMYYDTDDQAYIDVVIGEYSYTDASGVQLVNTLTNINTARPHDNNIWGLLILDRNLPVAERRMELIFTDPEREYLNRYIILKRIEGVIPQKIEVRWQGNMSIVPDENSSTEVRVPQEVYILEKQP